MNRAHIILDFDAMHGPAYARESQARRLVAISRQLNEAADYMRPIRNARDADTNKAKTIAREAHKALGALLKDMGK